MGNDKIDRTDLRALRTELLGHINSLCSDVSRISTELTENIQWVHNMALALQHEISSPFLVSLGGMGLIPGQLLCGGTCFPGGVAPKLAFVQHVGNSELTMLQAGDVEARLNAQGGTDMVYVGIQAYPNTFRVFVIGQKV